MDLVKCLLNLGIGQWKRLYHNPDEESSILTSFNRNFKGRNDGSVKTMNFLASPEIVTAIALSGKLSFNPIEDYLVASDGTKFKLSPPACADLPKDGFIPGRTAFGPPGHSLAQPEVKIEISLNSDRLQALAPFESWDGREFESLRILVKVIGKCTTDHISAAGPWLKYKGHLENLARNTLIGATNAFNSKVNSTFNECSKQYDTIPNTAFQYKKEGIPWAVIADWNYGEGSAREHASLQPRFLGCKTVISRSFARIHETNLKKQGILPLTFRDPADYDLIEEGSVLSTVGLSELSPGSVISLRVVQRDGSEIMLSLVHSMSIDQILWFKAGSALNATQ